MSPIYRFVVLAVISLGVSLLGETTLAQQKKKDAERTTAQVASQKNSLQAGYVQLSDGLKRYVEFVAPQSQDRPVVVLINGLVYDLSRWNVMRSELTAKGYGVLNYYIRGQFKTLRAELQQNSQPAFFKEGLTPEQLAEELKGILGELKIERPIVVVGLSYGASVAAEFMELYPASVEMGFFMAPLVLPSDRYNPQGQWIFQNLELLKLIWGPYLGNLFYDQAYNMIYRSYLEQRIVPERIPDEMKDIPREYKEAIFHLVRATREFDLRQYSFSKLNKNRVHFLLAKEEDERVFADQVQAFENVSKEAVGSLIYLTKSAHAIPDSQPKQAVTYMHYLMERDSRIQSDTKYFVDDEGLKLGLPNNK